MAEININVTDIFIRGVKMDRKTVIEYIKKKYGVSPEYPWKRNPDDTVFRHEDNGKWFALITCTAGSKLGMASAEPVDMINLKIDDLFFRDLLIREEGIFPGYHMNKLHWISVLLDGTVSDQQVYDLIETSFMATASANRKKKMRPPKEWIIPANPKYYDIEHAFDYEEEINWKQGAGVKTGDTVFMYVAAPVSAVLFKCKVTETDIPCDFRGGELSIKALMKIKLLKRYAPDEFTFERLKKEYGIFAVRGPRGIPNSLSADLKK